MKVQRIINTFKQLLRRRCSKSCIQFNKLSINFFINFIIWCWFFVTSLEVNMRKSNIICRPNAFIFVHFIQVNLLRLFLNFYSKTASNLDDIWSSRYRKTPIQLLGCCCTKSFIQFNKLSIKLLINLIAWLWFSNALFQVYICESDKILFP